MGQPRTGIIAAIATAAGRGGIGVVRVSGEGLPSFAEALTGRQPAPRQAMLSDFLGSDGVAIDRGILLFFPAPRSFTGEDVLELQGHGGPVVLQIIAESFKKSCLLPLGKKCSTLLRKITVDNALG